MNSTAETLSVVSEVQSVFQQSEDHRVARRLANAVRKAESVAVKKEDKAREIIVEMVGRVTQAKNAVLAAQGVLEVSKDNSAHLVEKSALEAKIANLEATQASLLSKQQALATAET